MAAHKNSGVSNGPNSRFHAHSAFKLHGVHIRLLQEAHRVIDGIFIGDLVGSEGHVAHDEGIGGPAADSLAVADAVLHCDGNGPLVAEGDHAK